MSTRLIRSLLPTIQVNRTQRGPLARAAGAGTAASRRHGGAEGPGSDSLTSPPSFLRTQWGFYMIQLQNHMIMGTPCFMFHFIKNFKVLKLN